MGTRAPCRRSRCRHGESWRAGRRAKTEGPIHAVAAAKPIRGRRRRRSRSAPSRPGCALRAAGAGSRRRPITNGRSRGPNLSGRCQTRAPSITYCFSSSPSSCCEPVSVSREMSVRMRGMPNEPPPSITTCGVSVKPIRAITLGAPPTLRTGGEQRERRRRAARGVAAQVGVNIANRIAARPHHATVEHEAMRAKSRRLLRVHSRRAQAAPGTSQAPQRT